MWDIVLVMCIPFIVFYALHQPNRKVSKIVINQQIPEHPKEHSKFIQNNIRIAHNKMVEALLLLYERK